MKTVIYYFSGTGNSLKIAWDLTKFLGDADVIPIAKAIRQDSVSPNADRIGIIYPVYMWGMPLIVNRFIKKLRTDKYIFAIANCGGMAAGALIHTKKRLEEQGMNLSSGFVVKMPANYTPMYGAQPQEKQNKLFKQAEDKIKAIADIIQAGKENPIEKSSFLSNFFFSSFIYNMGSSKIPESDKSFWVNEKCTSCGTCEKICPVDNIKLANEKPTWLHHCEQCMACLQWCPAEAIQFGKKTEGRKRYRNPSVKATDLMV
jgi:ferredoxin